MDNFIVPVVTGPTASGKTELVISAARRGLPLEIISADAFQVYRGLDIGTAKPERELRSEIPHHLVDILPPTASYNAGDFTEQAEECISNILAKGKTPIVVGGTGLYIRSLSEGLFDAPLISTELRESLKDKLKNEGAHSLYDTLLSVDPLSAQALHPNDFVRVLRALEVYYTTGAPIVEVRERLQTSPRFSYNIMVLSTERETLYRNINLRVSAMMKAGWLSEVERLLNGGVTEDMPSFRAIGYRELAAVIKGEMELTAATERIAQKTRNYAKRQNTWFRGMKDVRFMDREEMEMELLHLECKE